MKKPNYPCSRTEYLKYKWWWKSMYVINVAGYPIKTHIMPNGRIKGEKYYILDMYDYDYGIMVIDHKFDTKYQAYREIDRKLKGDRVRYWVVKGKLLFYQKLIVLYPPRYRIGLSFTKYDMPPEVMTMQERKSYRTKLRRRKRRSKKKK